MVLLVLLQYHAQLEMKEAIQNAILRNFRSMLDTRVEPLNPLLVLHVHRDSIVQDAINQVKKNFAQKIPFNSFGNISVRKTSRRRF